MSSHSLQPDELLSACHDGELSAAEQAEVDRLLEETPALQETLDDFAELTTILQSIPRSQAPETLQQNVLRRIAANAPNVSSSASPPSRRTPWLWGLSLVATAAVLFVMVQVNSPRTGELASARQEDAQKLDSLAMSEGQADLGAAGMIESELAVAESSPMEQRVAASNAADADSALDSDGARSRRERLLPAPESSPSPAAASAVPQMTASAAAFGDAQLAERLNINPDSPPSATDVLAYMDRVGDQTVVVEFDVVDINRTMDDMVLLLQRRGVTVVGAADVAEAGASQPARKAFSDEEAAPLVALYVEAPEPQLAGMLDDVISEVSISDGAAYNTFVAGPLVNRRLVEFENRYGDRSRPAPAAPVPSVAPADEPTAEPAAEPAAEASDKDEAQSEEAPKAADAPVGAIRRQAPRLGGAQRNQQSVAQGVRLNLPDASYRRIEQREGLADDRNSGQSVTAARDARTFQAVPRPDSSSDGQERGGNQVGGAAAAPETERLQRLLIVLQPEMVEGER